MNETTFGDISRESLDASDIVAYKTITEPWLREEVVRQISASNNEPEWMLELRLKAFDVYQKMNMPKWGPNLEKLKLDDIYYFAKPEWAKNTTNWEDVPEEIKKTFDRLGIPEAERKMLAGTGAQYDSEVVYHNLKQELKEKWVIFEDMSVALHKYEDIVKKHFMKATNSSSDCWANDSNPRWAKFGSIPSKFSNNCKVQQRSWPWGSEYFITEMTFLS